VAAGFRPYKAVAIIGAGFIGSECAASLKTHYKDRIEVHLIDVAEYPLEGIFGKEIGKSFAKAHEDHGVILHMKTGVSEVTVNARGRVNGVILTDKDKTRLKVGMVLVGTGILPRTDFLKGTGIQLDKQGAVVCDAFN